MRTPSRGGKTANTESLKERENLARAIDNVRVQRLIGILPKKGKATLESIPEIRKDKSMYSCARYQFFLEAPFEIGQNCCRVMKKEPFARYHKETGRAPFLGMMASESKLRTQSWLKSGCNAFDAAKQASSPMMFWVEQDVLLYIYQNKLPIASVYGEVVKEEEIEGQMDFSDYGLFDEYRPTLKTTGCGRTGCCMCGFGIHLERNPNRFELMKDTHPKIYEYIMKPWDEGGLGYKEVIDWINEHGDMDIRY